MEFKTLGRGTKDLRMRHPSPQESPNSLRNRRYGARQPPAELHMDSHTQMQILAPGKPGKWDAMDFSLQTPLKRSHFPNLWNLWRRRSIAPAAQRKQSQTSRERKKANRTRAPTLGRKNSSRARRPCSNEMHRSRRDVMVYQRVEPYQRRQSSTAQALSPRRRQRTNTPLRRWRIHSGFLPRAWTTNQEERLISEGDG